MLTLLFYFFVVVGPKAGENLWPLYQDLTASVLSECRNFEHFSELQEKVSKQRPNNFIWLFGQNKTVQGQNQASWKKKY